MALRVTVKVNGVVPLSPSAFSVGGGNRQGRNGQQVSPLQRLRMRQAIQEGFIHDVLKNYTTYKTYYRLIKAIEDDPQVSKSKAANALARFMILHSHNIAQKTEVMLEHLHTFTRHKIGGRAKAMVVNLAAANVKMVLDTYHLGLDGGLLDRIAQLVPHIALVQLGDARRPPDGEQNRCRLGEGVVPLGQIVAALKAGGYDGYYDVELLGEEIEPADYRSLLEHAKEAFGTLVGSGEGRGERGERPGARERERGEGERREERGEGREE